MTERFSKNDDPDGCPDRVMGDCVYACVYCGSDGDAKLGAAHTRLVELGAKSEWVARLWRDWPQERREGVRRLSGHLHDAIEDLARQFDAADRKEQTCTTDAPPGPPTGTLTG